MKTSLSIFLVCAVGVASAQAASFDCVAPVFPGHSTSEEGVRRIEKQVRQWRACNASHRSNRESADVDKLRIEVDASLAKWIAATRASSNGQFSGQHLLTRMESEKVEHGKWMRGSSQAPATAAGAGKL